MKRPRLVVTLALLAIALFGAAGWYLFFSSTNYSLQRAESLSFRRMVIAQLDRQGTYRFHFATNRTPVEQAPTPEEGFDATRSPGMRFGAFDVGIEPTLGLGMLINPTEWFQNREIQLEQINPLDQEAFAEQLGATVDRTPERSLLIVIHGFREAFPTALRRTAFLGHVLDMNKPILLFDWPGNQGSSIRGFRQAREVAIASAEELADLITLIDRDISPDRLSIVANSMGAQVVVEAFLRLYRDGAHTPGKPLVNDVLLTAPDVDYQEFNETFRAALTALAGRTTLYVSSNDRALLASRLLNRGKRLGESSLRPWETGRNLRVIDDDPNDDQVIVIDVTPVNRTRNFHNFSLETPEFYDDMYLRLGNERIPSSRLLYPVESREGSVYWVLTRSR